MSPDTEGLQFDISITVEIMMPNLRRRLPAGKLMLYMDADVIGSLKRYAAGTEQSCNAVMSKAITAYLAEKRGA